MRRGLLVLDLDNTVLYRQGFFHGLRLYVGSEDATGQRTGAEEAASAAAAAVAASLVLSLLFSCALPSRVFCTCVLALPCTCLDLGVLESCV